ncbi:MAG TPA: acetate--CoA ligase family protein, partial [Candidatus Dormibacteraeota bacterium]|nr:acetate--CoA ligase family protein [Candidatus Dormibacteraeota bacterium]
MTATTTPGTSADLHRLFHPRRVAVVGASDTPHRPNTALYRKVKAKVEPEGAVVFPVNPTRDSLDGVRCYHSLLDIDGDLDLAVVLTGDPVPAVEEAVQKGVGYVIVFAAGFAEVGTEEGRQAQQRMTELCGPGRTRLMGPNTNANAFEAFRTDLGGRKLALITQSGHQGRPVAEGETVGIPMYAWAPLGNEADLECADFIEYFADVAEVGAITMYIEGFKNGERLRRACEHALERGVPVICIKVGRTAAGQDMAMAHTAHLTGEDAVVDAVLAQHGVVRVDGLDELLEIGAMFSRLPAPRGDGVCVYAISGGTGAHFSDLAATAGLRMPRLTQETADTLHQWIAWFLRTDNPVDTGAGPNADERGRLITDAIVKDPNIDLVIVPITGALPFMAERFVNDLIAVSEYSPVPIVVIWGSPDATQPAYQMLLEQQRMPVFRNFQNCIRGVRAYYDYHGLRTRYRSAFADAMAKPGDAAQTAATMLASHSGVVPDVDALRILGAAGIVVAGCELAGDDAAVEAAANRLAGANGLVVLKTASADIPHRSEHGLVAVGVAPKDAVSAAGRLRQHAAQTLPSARLDGVLVCEQVGDGVEVIVGV